MQFISVVDVPVIILGRSQDSREVAGAICKGDTLSVVLAKIAGDTLVLFVMLHAFAGAFHHDG